MSKLARVKQWMSSGVVLDGVFALGIKSIGAVSAFLMNIAVARVLGVHEAGVYFLGLTVVTVLAAASRLGLDNSVVRFVAEDVDDLMHDRVHGIYRKASGWVLVASLIVAVGWVLFYSCFGERLFRSVELQDMTFPVACAIPLIALYTIHSHVLLGLRLVVESTFVLNVVVPFLITIGLMVLPIRGASGAGWLLVGVCGLNLALARALWKFRGPPLKLREEFDARVLWNSCFPLLGVMMLGQLIQWSSQLILGVSGSSAEVAMFSSGQRVAMLTSIILMAVNSVVAPKFAAMNRTSNIEGIRVLMAGSVRALLALSIPITVLLWVYAEAVMGLFGSEFREGFICLRILLIGQFVNMASGSVGVLLMMSGHERTMRVNMFVGACLGVGLGLCLIPQFGLVGASIATASAVAVQNLLGVYQVKRVLGFNALAFWN